MDAGRRWYPLALVLLLTAAAVPAVVRADTIPPAIDAVWWEPRYPIHPDNVTVYARVSDLDGISLVEATFCYQPPFLCLYESMSDPDADGVFTVVPRGPGGTSTQDWVIGATLSISAVDTANNGGVTPKQGILFADSLNLTFDRSVIDAEPGQSFSVSGTAFYEDNTTAPAEGITVNVGIAGNWSIDVVDAAGAFSVSLVAPASEGTWTITAMASDRTLMDTEESTLAVSVAPRPDLTISDVRVSPTVPVAGEVTLSFHARNVGTADAINVRVLVEVLGMPSRTILNGTYAISARGGDVPLVTSWNAPVGRVTVRITIDPEGAIDELNEANNAIDYPISVHAPPVAEIPAFVWIGGGVATLTVAILLGTSALARRNVRVSPKVIAIVAVAVAAILVAAAAVSTLGTPSTAPRPAPEFGLVDIDGIPLNSTGLRGNVTLLEISGTWCEPCRIVENAFKDIFPAYRDRIVFLTVFIPPLNNQTSLDLHRQDRGIPSGWHLATDTDNVQTKFGIASLPRVFVINREGYVTLDWQPTPYSGLSQSAVKQAVVPALDRTLAGQATTVAVTALSIPALLVVAAFLSFFSPCSFPVLPAFMSYYLNLDAKGERKASPKVAMGRGFVASLGMVTVYGIIALVVIAAGIAAQRTLPYLSPTIGVVLILAAVLSLLPFQYHWITRPFVALKNRIAAKLAGRWAPGMRTKLFAFGAGYGAAGFACVAPPFIGAMLNASALGQPEQAVLGLLLYVAIVIGLMIAVTVALTLAGDRALKRVRAWSGAMKYISAIALLVAGGYLLWLFYVSSVAG